MHAEGGTRSTPLCMNAHICPFAMEPRSSTRSQPNEKAPVLFTVMCVLTILGNLLLLVVNLFKVAMLDTGIQNGSVGAEGSYYLSLLLQLILLSCVGAIIGAALMLAGKRLGYWIYAISIGLHIVLTVCAMVLWAMTIFLVGFAGLLLLYCVIPVSFFLYFHAHRAHLT